MADQLNPTSRDWKIVAEWATTKLDEARKSNDHKQHDAVATAYLRGKIAAYQATLALANPPTLEPSRDD